MDVPGIRALHPQVVLAALEHVLTIGEPATVSTAAAMVIERHLLDAFIRRLPEAAGRALEAYLSARVRGEEAPESCAERYVAFLQPLPISPWREAERAYALNFLSGFPASGFDRRALEALEEALDSDECPAWLLAQAVMQLGSEEAGKVLPGDERRFLRALTKGGGPDVPLRRLLALGWDDPWTILSVDLLESSLDQERDRWARADDGERRAALRLWAGEVAEHDQPDGEEDGDEVESVLEEAEDEADGEEGDTAPADRGVSPASEAGLYGDLEESVSAGGELAVALGLEREGDREFLRTTGTGFWPEPLRRDKGLRQVHRRVAAGASAPLVYAYRRAIEAPQSLVVYALALAHCLEAAKEIGDLRPVARFALLLADVVEPFEIGWFWFGVTEGMYEDLDELASELGSRVGRLGLDPRSMSNPEEQGVALALTEPESVAARLRALGAAAALLSVRRADILSSPEVPEEFRKALGAPIPADSVLGGDSSAERPAADLETVTAVVTAAVTAAVKPLASQRRGSPMERGRERLRRFLGDLADSGWVNERPRIVDDFGHFEVEALEERDEEIRANHVARACRDRATRLEEEFASLFPERVFGLKGGQRRSAGFGIREVARCLEDGTWERAFSPEAKRVVNTAWPDEEGRRRLGRLVDSWRRPRNTASHRPRELGHSARRFLLPEAFDPGPRAGGSDGNIFDLLRLIVQGGIRLESEGALGGGALRRP
jgi:hypothetical protein